MSIPIILVHKGDPYYLDFSLNQVHLSNPNNPIYLITDKVTNRYSFVKYILMDEFMKEANEFRKIYKHMSTNSFENELFCFQRWFVIKEFCIKNGLNDFLYIDSDLLLFAKVDEVFSKFSEYDFTSSKKLGPHCCYFSSLDKLKKFCDFTIKFYTEADYMARFEKKHQYHLKNNLNGGVCDMTAFYEYQMDFPKAAKELFVIENKETFDDNINEADGYVMQNGIKKISFENGQPYGTLLNNGEKIKFKTLHFQGRAKKLISGYYLGTNLDALKKKLSMDKFLLEHNLLHRVFNKLGYKIALH